MPVCLNATHNYAILWTLIFLIGLVIVLGTLTYNKIYRDNVEVAIILGFVLSGISAIPMIALWADYHNYKDYPYSYYCEGTSLKAFDKAPDPQALENIIEQRVTERLYELRRSTETTRD